MTLGASTLPFSLESTRLHLDGQERPDAIIRLIGDAILNVVPFSAAAHGARMPTISRKLDRAASR